MSFMNWLRSLDRVAVALTIGTVAVLGITFGAIAGLTDHHENPARCSTEQVQALAGGLAYAQGYRAGLLTNHAPTTDVKRSDRDIAATLAALTACRP